NDLDLNLDNIEVKINLNSEGKIQLIGKLGKNTAAVIFIIGTLTVSLAGGGLKIDALGMDLKTDGIVKAVTNYENNKQNREIIEKFLKEKMDSLQIKSPDDVEKF